MEITLSLNDLQIIKEALEHKWEEYRAEGDETGLYERIIAAIGDLTMGV